MVPIKNYIILLFTIMNLVIGNTYPKFESNIFLKLYAPLQSKYLIFYFFLHLYIYMNIYIHLNY